MTINDIQSEYNSLCKKNKKIISDFSTCSKYTDEHGKACFFVKSTKQCYNFEKICGQIESLARVDSLFIDTNKNIVYFIEFKHESVTDDKVKSNILASGLHSRLWHGYILENAKDFVRKDFTYIYLVCIKNDKHNVRLLAAYKRTKMYGDRCEYNFYNDLHGKLCSKKINAKPLFDDLIFMDDNQFDAYFC